MISDLLLLLQPEFKFLHPITHKESSCFLQARCAGVHLALWQKASCIHVSDQVPH